MPLLCVCLQMAVETTLSFYLGITDTFLQVGEFTNAEPAGPEAYLHLHWQAGPQQHLGEKVPAGEAIRVRAQG